jgi:hypothetical protein
MIAASRPTHGLPEVPVPCLPPEWLPHFSAGISHRLGTCSRSGRPGICRGVGADVLPDGRVIVLVARDVGGPALAAVEETGQVALVLARPFTHRTLHLKGHDAEIVETQPAHHDLLARRFDEFATQIEPFGFTREQLAANWYRVGEGNLAVVRFSVSGAWDQTPGPGAGQPVALQP